MNTAGKRGAKGGPGEGSRETSVCTVERLTHIKGCIDAYDQTPLHTDDQPKRACVRACVPSHSGRGQTAMLSHAPECSLKTSEPSGSRTSIRVDSAWPWKHSQHEERPCLSCTELCIAALPLRLSAGPAPFPSLNQTA